VLPHGQSSTITATVLVAFGVPVPHSHSYWRSQGLWNVDAEAWSKLSVFCKAEVCFSAQSIIAQKKLGRVFAPACYILATWFSFENLFFLIYLRLLSFFKMLGFFFLILGSLRFPVDE